MAFGSSASSVSWRLWAFSGGVGDVLDLFLFDGLVCRSIPLGQGDLHHRKDRKARRQRRARPGPRGRTGASGGRFSARMAAITPSANPSGTGVSSTSLGRRPGWPGCHPHRTGRHRRSPDAPAPGGRLPGGSSAVHTGVQQGRKFLTGIHLSALLFLILWTQRRRKFPLLSKKNSAACFRAPVDPDFTVPTSRLSSPGRSHHSSS